jgi:hypothetical protein
MRHRPLALAIALLIATDCASGHRPAPAPRESTAADSLADLTGQCRREAEVTVHVENQSSMDVEITFGPYSPGRAAQGLSHTTYRVPRPYLQQSIWLRARGALQTEGPSEVRTEFVACSDATLIIGARPNHSFFYGALIESPPGRPKRGDTTGVLGTPH